MRKVVARVQSTRTTASLIYNFIHVCVSVRFVFLKVIRFDIPAPTATKLHTCTKDLPGKVLKPTLIS